ncbi:protein-L-isoaspartate O-methyltransferase family protein [Novosphingobium cyanobacteriorum]|uniref:Protein-L-isoaspartate O-methyltransferase n=1 Tax=Novosphingobium cyanobacteriorum TaxID=3024215 RepID=A0ABT6CGL3_9SPHN|nr:protein-L-isoaspartate O-methyltransferase [Novosphingobium cyanobacteriorum]MDF8333067.1 protein-L-isoaspartate O-methyltransferase [Novosphingobium cyanobacteriorum]
MNLVQDRPAEGEFSSARRAMIDSQLRVSGVNDPAILAAFASVAREDYVPAERRAVAYIDRAVPLGDAGVLSPALTHGQMLTAAAPVAADTVLVVSRNGYLAALASQMVASVTQVAPDGDWTAGGPFTLVLVDGAIEVVPDALSAALAAEGRIVTGMVDRGVTRLEIGRKVAGEVAFTALGEADFAILPEFVAKQSWSF